MDEESGLYYYGARYYDPRISIWASVDPLVYDGTFLEGSHNGGFFNSFNHGSYIYCYQSPARLVDPNGKQVDVVTYGIKNKYDDNYVKNVANTSASSIGVKAQGINTGKELIKTLESAGRISTLVNWGHSWNVGLYLNNDAGFYSDGYKTGNQSANLSDLRNSKIKTNTHSLFIFASCGTSGDGTGYNNYDSSSFVATFGDYINKGNDVGAGVWNYKVTTIGATALSNLLEDGTVKTDGSFIMTEKTFQISKKAVYKTEGYLWWKKSVFSHWNIKTKMLEVKTTNLGNKINPAQIIENHDHNESKIK